MLYGYNARVRYVIALLGLVLVALLGLGWLMIRVNDKIDAWYWQWREEENIKEVPPSAFM